MSGFNVGDKVKTISGGQQLTVTATYSGDSGDYFDGVDRDGGWWDECMGRFWELVPPPVRPPVEVGQSYIEPWREGRTLVVLAVAEDDAWMQMPYNARATVTCDWLQNRCTLVVPEPTVLLTRGLFVNTITPWISWSERGDWSLSLMSDGTFVLNPPQVG